MCLPWNHKWETRSRKYIKTTNGWGMQAVMYTLEQRCTHCGKEIVRKYRV